MTHAMAPLSRSLPKTSREDFELIFTELDQSGDFKVCSVSLLLYCNTPPLPHPHPHPQNGLLYSI